LVHDIIEQLMTGVISRRVNQGFFHSFHFLPNRPAHNLLQTRASNVIAQCIVNQGLVIPAAHFVNPFAEVIKDFIVQPYGDPGLARLRRYDRTALALAETILRFINPARSARAQAWLPGAPKLS
jgi:hypothetical protein